MNSSNKAGIVLRTYPLRFSPFDIKDIAIFLINGGSLVFVAACGGKIIFELLSESTSIVFNSDEFWILIILTSLVYLYSLAVAQASVKAFEKRNSITNITQILRFLSVGYYLGVCIIYLVIVKKLGERDYDLYWRYFQYIVVLIICFLAARLYAHIPKAQDVWVLALMIMSINLFHLSYIVYQYVIDGANQYDYFFQDIFVLIGMAFAGIYTMVGSWRVK